MKNKFLFLFIFLIILPGFLFSQPYFAPGVSVTGGGYFAVPRYDYLLTSGADVRTQAYYTADLNLFAVSSNKLTLGAGLSFGKVSKSLAVGSSIFKGFSYFGGVADVSYFITDQTAVGAGIRVLGNYLDSPNDKFNSLDFFARIEYLPVHSNYVNTSFILPVTVSYRKDIIGIEIGIGVKFKMLALNQVVKW